MKPPIAWPDGKRFAFSIFDDTDAATVENVGGVYRFLADSGFRTTKSCWVFRGDPHAGKYPGEVLEDAAYRQWLVELQAQGFEIGWHGVTWHGSDRARTAAGLDRFAEIFQHYPAVAANHTGVKEAMYWGACRLSGWRRSLYNLLTKYRNIDISRGQLEGDEHFWGDLCRQKVKYYRNFVFRDINTSSACPLMPYHDPKRPFVNYWFASSDGNHLPRFVRCLCEAAQDRLEAEGGACIMYTHFACGFTDNGRIEPRFKALMERLARKNGWFVPVGQLLDHLLTAGGPRVITDSQRRRLERKWILEKIFVGSD
jgi:hypothetical protein